jgi:hypothetical protein
MATTMNKIQPKKKYSLMELHKMNVFPWVKSFAAYRNIIMNDKASKDLLKTEIVGERPFRGYFILGKHVIEFVKSRKSVK